jgi:hypothetical protein
MVIQESHGILDAIKHLDMYKENIFDKLTVLEIYGKLTNYVTYDFFDIVIIHIIILFTFLYIYLIKVHYTCKWENIT